jgi:hypothetical protein
VDDEVNVREGWFAVATGEHQTADGSSLQTPGLQVGLTEQALLQ